MRRLFFFLLVLLCQLHVQRAFAQEQNGTVKGQVRNENGEGVPGVSVTVTNKKSNYKAGTQTDTAGTFTFRLPAGTGYRFVFSSVGYTEQMLQGYDVRANGVTTVSAKMTASSANLNEVVVIGYGAVKKRDLTGAVVSLKGDELKEIPTTN